MSNENAHERHSCLGFVIQNISISAYRLCLHWVSKLMHVTIIATFYWRLRLI